MPASSIGQRLKAVRLRAGMYQDAFGDALGYSKRSVIAWENDATNLPIAVLATIRRVYDVDPEWMILGEDMTPRRNFRGVDWARLDRLECDVDAICQDVGVALQAPGHSHLVRLLFDDGVEDDDLNRRWLPTLLAVLGRPAAHTPQLQDAGIDHAI